MTNLRQRAAAWLGQQMQSAAGWAVTYADGSKSCSITATPSMKRYEVVKDGMPTEVVLYDFLVTASELVTSRGEVLEPRLGATITVSLNGVQERYLLVPHGDKMQPVERMDGAGVLLRLHTQKVS